MIKIKLEKDKSLDIEVKGSTPEIAYELHQAVLTILKGIAGNKNEYKALKKSFADTILNIPLKEEIEQEDDIFSLLRPDRRKNQFPFKRF